MLTSTVGVTYFHNCIFTIASWVHCCYHDQADSKADVLGFLTVNLSKKNYGFILWKSFFGCTLCLCFVGCVIGAKVSKWSFMWQIFRDTRGLLKTRHRRLNGLMQARVHDMQEQSV